MSHQSPITANPELARNPTPSNKLGSDPFRVLTSLLGEGNYYMPPQKEGDLVKNIDSILTKIGNDYADKYWWDPDVVATLFKVWDATDNESSNQKTRQHRKTTLSTALRIQWSGVEHVEPCSVCYYESRACMKFVQSENNPKKMVRRCGFCATGRSYRQKCSKVFPRRTSKRVEDTFAFGENDDETATCAGPTGSKQRGITTPQSRRQERHSEEESQSSDDQDRPPKKVRCFNSGVPGSSTPYRANSWESGDVPDATASSSSQGWTLRQDRTTTVSLSGHSPSRTSFGNPQDETSKQVAAEVPSFEAMGSDQHDLSDSSSLVPDQVQLTHAPENLEFNFGDGSSAILAGDKSSTPESTIVGGNCPPKKNTTSRQEISTQDDVDPLAGDPSPVRDTRMNPLDRTRDGWDEFLQAAERIRDDDGEQRKMIEGLMTDQINHEALQRVRLETYDRELRKEWEDEKQEMEREIKSIHQTQQDMRTSLTEIERSSKKMQRELADEQHARLSLEKRLEESQEETQKRLTEVEGRLREKQREVADEQDARKSLEEEMQRRLADEKHARELLEQTVRDRFRAFAAVFLQR